jgi:hypothetical protein
MSVEDWREALRSNSTGAQAQAKYSAISSRAASPGLQLPQEAQDEVFLRAARRNEEYIGERSRAGRARIIQHCIPPAWWRIVRRLLGM